MQRPITLKNEVPGWVRVVHGICTGVLIAALALTCHRVHVEEAAGGGIVVARAQVVEA
jgi:hypothetical protein